MTEVKIEALTNCLTCLMELTVLSVSSHANNFVHITHIEGTKKSVHTSNIAVSIENKMIVMKFKT